MTSAALKAVATDQVKPRHKTILDFLEDPRVKTGLAAVAGKFLAPDRMLKLCVNAVKKTPLLLQCDPQTVLGAMMTSAALGLEPNTIQQQAFLIPYKRRQKVGTQWLDVYDCQFQVGARGFVTLAYRSPRVKALQAEAIHEGDLFEHMMGSESFLRYAKALKNRGELIGAFSHVRLADGFETACVLPLDELHKIREKSETYRALVRNVQNAENEKDRLRAELKLAETPWVMWEDDMAAKSGIKKHAKQLPIASSDALMAAAEIDNRGEASALDLKTMADPDAVRAVIGGDVEPPALENNPSEVLEEHPGEDHEHVQVPVSEAGAAAAGNHIDPADRPDAGADPEPPRQATQRPQGRAKGEKAGPSYEQLAQRLHASTDKDVADLILDEARGLPPEQQQDLERLHAEKFPD